MEKIYIYILCFVVFVIVLGIILYLRSKRDAAPAMDDMEGKEFEQYCAELLAERDFEHIILTKESGDYGIDILAEKEHVTYAVQCKRYGENVGVSAIMQAYAGCAYYDRMVAVVMTNQHFTKPAREMAEKLKVLLWDRTFFEE